MPGSLRSTCREHVSAYPLILLSAYFNGFRLSAYFNGFRLSAYFNGFRLSAYLNGFR